MYFYKLKTEAKWLLRACRQRSLRIANVCLLKDWKLLQDLRFAGKELRRAGTLSWKVSEADGMT